MLSKWLVSRIKADENDEEHHGDSNQPRQCGGRVRRFAIRGTHVHAYIHIHMHVYIYVYIRVHAWNGVTFQFCRDDGFLGCAKKRVLIGTRRGQVPFKGSFCSFLHVAGPISSRFFPPQSLIRHSFTLRNCTLERNYHRYAYDIISNRLTFYGGVYEGRFLELLVFNHLFFFFFFSGGLTCNL